MEDNIHLYTTDKILSSTSINLRKLILLMHVYV